MATATIGKLNVIVAASTAKYVKGLKAAEARMRTFKKRIAVAGAVAAAGMVIAGKRALAMGDELAKTSRKLGTTTEGLAKLRHAGELTGVATRTLDMGIQRMTRRLSEAAIGTGEAQGAIKELGLDAKRLAKLAPTEAFAEIAEKMRQVENQADRVRLSFKLFDSEGVALVNTLKLGRSGLQQAGEELQSLGAVYSAKALAKLEDLRDATLRLKMALSALATQSLIAVAGKLQVTADMASRTVAAFNNMSTIAKRLTLSIASITGAIIALSAAARGVAWLWGGTKLLKPIALVAVANATAGMTKFFMVLEKAALVFSAGTFATLATGVAMLGTIVAGTGYLFYQVFKPQKIQRILVDATEGVDAFGDAILTVANNLEEVRRRGSVFRALVPGKGGIEAMMTRAKENRLANQQFAQGIRDRTTALHDEIATLKMGRREFELYALSREAMAKGQRAELAALTRTRNALEDIQSAQAKLAASAKMIWERTRNPIERYIETLREIRAVFAQGGIGLETMARAMRQARETLTGGRMTAAMQMPPALERGSAAAFSAIHKHQAGSQQNPVVKIAQQSDKKLARAVALLTRIDAKIGRRSDEPLLEALP